MISSAKPVNQPANPNSGSLTSKNFTSNLFNRMKSAVMGTQVRLNKTDKITLVIQHGDSYDHDNLDVFYVNDKSDRHVQIIVNGMNNILSERIIKMFMNPKRDVDTTTMTVEQLAVSIGDGVKNDAIISVNYLDTKQLIDTDKLSHLGKYLDKEFIGLNNTQTIQHVQILGDNGVTIYNPVLTISRALDQLIPKPSDPPPLVNVSEILKNIQTSSNYTNLRIVCEVPSNMRQGGRKTRRYRRKRSTINA